jgi:hypothetical protein
MSSSVPSGWREAKTRRRGQVDLAELLKKNVPAGTREAGRYKHRPMLYLASSRSKTILL